jgi:hypothetical protein
MDAIAAITFDPSFIKGHYRRACALIDLGQREKAMAAVELGLQIKPSEATLLELKKRLSAEAKVEEIRESLDLSREPDSYIRDRLKKAGAAVPLKGEGSPQEAASVLQSIQMLNTMAMLANMNVTGSKVDNPRLGAFDFRSPPFHSDFARLGLWPAQCDVSKCQERLTHAFEHSRIGSLNLQYSITSRPEPTVADLQKRLGSSHPARILWYAGRLEPGDVNPQPFKDAMYNPTELHSFSNEVYSPEYLILGTTVVSVGFVDMGFLREAVYGPAKDPMASVPLRWIGFEATAYCVAKTAVIASMMELGEDVDCVLQVWYSAAWTRKTLDAFRRGLLHLICGNSKVLGADHPDVKALLLHWQSSGTVSLAAARSGWLEITTDLARWRLIGNFKDPNDRMALCTYSLTGQLLDADVGSVVMFTFPAGYQGTLATNDSVFNTISLTHLMAERQTSTDVVQAAVEYLRKGIQKVSALIKNGSILVDVRLHAVEPSDKAVIASIAALDPYNISWNNVPDYIDPKAFHKMARACSGTSTVHHSYSMNWPTAVYGASVTDFLLPSKVNGLEDISFLNEIVDKIGSSMQTIHELYGASHLLLAPPIDDARNLVDFKLYMDYRHYWEKAFFSCAGMRDPSKQVLEGNPPEYNILSRTNSTVLYTFTYNSNVVLFDAATSETLP